MGYITIENDGQPWVICLPSDPGDLDRFMNISKAEAIGTGLKARAATPQEARRCSAARMLGLMNGDDPDRFFGIPV